MTFRTMQLAIALVSSFCISLSHAATFYVAPTGSDSSTGSLSSPFKTLTKAGTMVAAGDTIMLRGGTYREFAEMWKGGAAGSLVLITNYPGETPVLKGSEVVTDWVLHTGNIWKKTGWASNAQQVFVDFDTKPGKSLQQIGMPSSYYTNFEYNAAIGTGLTSMTAGTFYHDRVSTLYVWLPDGSDPNTHVMEVSVRPRILYLRAPYVYVKGLYFRHTNSSAVDQQGSAIELSSNSTIEGCDIQWADFSGLTMGYYAVNTAAIGNNVSNNGNSGINAPGSMGFKVSQNKMNNNNYRNFNALWHAGGFKAAAKAYGVVEANEVAYNNGSGVWFDYANSGSPIVIRNNYIHHNGPKDSAIYLEVTSNALVYNNLLVDNERRGVYLSATSNVQVLNNTIVGTKTWASIDVNGMPRDVEKLTNNTIYNNIISGSTTAFDLFIATPNGTTIYGNKSNYNNIYRGTAGVINVNGASTLDGWRSTSGNDLNSISADPSFVGTGNQPYLVNSGSPVIDAGMSLTQVPTDYNATSRPLGGGYDMGAFESSYTGSVPPPPTTTPPPPPPTSTGDTMMPVVTISSPTNGASVSGVVMINASATDNVGVIGMSLQVDGAVIATSNTGSISGEWSTAGLRLGSHTIRVAASDAANNTGTAYYTVNVVAGTTDPTVPPPTTTPPPPTPTTDTVTPIVKINEPNASPIYISGRGKVTISATATDNVKVVEMKIFIDGTLRATTTSGSASYVWDIKTTTSGNHAIRVTATDAAGNVGVANSTAIVR